MRTGTNTSEPLNGQVTQSPAVVFKSVYKDVQRLHQLDRKILRAKQAIESNIEVLMGCDARLKRHVRIDEDPDCGLISQDLNMQRHEYMGYSRTLQEMLDYSGSISHLVISHLHTCTVQRLMWIAVGNGPWHAA